MQRIDISMPIENDVISDPPRYVPQVVLTIDTVQNYKNAKGREDIIAATTDNILNAFAKHPACFKVFVT